MIVGSFDAPSTDWLACDIVYTNTLDEPFPASSISGMCVFPQGH